MSEESLRKVLNNLVAERAALVEELSLLDRATEAITDLIDGKSSSNGAATNGKAQSKPKPKLVRAVTVPLGLPPAPTKPRSRYLVRNKAVREALKSMPGKAVNAQNVATVVFNYKSPCRDRRKNAVVQKHLIRIANSTSTDGKLQRVGRGQYMWVPGKSAGQVAEPVVITSDSAPTPSRKPRVGDPSPGSLQYAILLELRKTAPFALTRSELAACLVITEEQVVNNMRHLLERVLHDGHIEKVGDDSYQFVAAPIPSKKKRKKRKRKPKDGEQARNGSTSEMVLEVLKKSPGEPVTLPDICKVLGLSKTRQHASRIAGAFLVLSRRDVPGLEIIQPGVYRYTPPSGEDEQQ